MRSLSRAFIAAFILAAPTGLAAQECTIEPEQLIGLIDKGGGCVGISKEFAQKYMHIGLSQCQPLPKKGHMMLGRCVVDAPETPVAAKTDNDELQELRARVIQMDGEISELREQMRSQYLLLMSEIDYLKSTLESSRRK